MKKTISLKEKDLHRIIKECVNGFINEAVDGGWEVDTFEADDAYELALQQIFDGEEAGLDSAIVGCMGKDNLAKCLAFLFRQWDFRAWPEHQESKQNEMNNESKIRRIVEDTINEIGDTDKGQYMLGRLQKERDSKNGTWRASWVADDARDEAALDAEKNGGRYNTKYNRMLRAYRDGYNGVKW